MVDNEYHDKVEARDLALAARDEYADDKAEHDSRMATAALEMVEGVELVVTGGNIEAMAVKVAKVKGWLAMFINEKRDEG